MKVGYTNQLDDAIFSGGSNPTFARNNDSLNVTTLGAGLTLTITPVSALTLEFLSIFNCDATALEIKITKTIAGVLTTNLTTADATGFEYNNYLVDIDSTDTTTVIAIKNDGATSCDVGYVWAGEWIDFKCAENIQFFDESTENTTIDRRNKPTKDDGYFFQTVNVTTKKDVEFATLKTNIRKILNTGFSVPRPFLFDDKVIDNELIYGILANGRVGYDTYQVDNTNETIAQCTIEIREVT